MEAFEAKLIFTLFGGERKNVSGIDLVCVLISEKVLSLQCFNFLNSFYRQLLLDIVWELLSDYESCNRRITALSYCSL